jgi:hypothetical protein
MLELASVEAVMSSSGKVMVGPKYIGISWLTDLMRGTLIKGTTKENTIAPSKKNLLVVKQVCRARISL